MEHGTPGGRRADVRTIALHDYASLPPAERVALEAVVQELRTLGDVLTWARGQTPPRTVDEIVTQDEYTHDVVLEAGGDGQPYLVFDTT
jgi:hypothetical protein